MTTKCNLVSDMLSQFKPLWFYYKLLYLEIFLILYFIKNLIINLTIKSLNNFVNYKL